MTRRRSAGGAIIGIAGGSIGLTCLTLTAIRLATTGTISIAMIVVMIIILVVLNVYWLIDAIHDWMIIAGERTRADE